MTKSPKFDKDDSASEKTDENENSSEERSYYYDDACGYEVYDAEADSDEDAENSQFAKNDAAKCDS